MQTPSLTPSHDARGPTAVLDRHQQVVVRLTRFGGPQGFELVEQPLPAAGPGQVRKKHPDWYRADLEKLFALLAAKTIRPRIELRIDLDGVADAHRRLEAGGMTGKIIICPPVAPTLP